MRKLIGLMSGLAVGMLTISGADAQSQCAPRTEVVKVLAAKYQESQRALGLINEKAMMEIYVSPKGTWTMVVTNEQGVSCVLADGEAWDEKPTVALGPSS
ncbi:MAG: hypothetical protein ACOZAM_31025 [Pseudomonadota bacterium]